MALKPMHQLFHYVQQRASLFWFASGASICNKVLDLMPPLLVGWVIDSVSGTPPGWIAAIPGLDTAWNMAVFLAILGVVIFAFESLFEWLFQRSFMTLAQDIQHQLRLDVYQKLQSREIAFFENQRMGKTLAILNDDVNQLERFLNTGFNEILQLVVLFVFSLTVMLGTSWELSLISLLPLPLIFMGSLWYQKKIAPRYDKVRQSVEALASRLENNLAGMLVIQSFTAEQFEMERVRTSSEAYRAANLKAIQLAALYIPIIRMAIAVGFGGVLLLGAYWVLEGSGRLSVGELVLFSMLVQRLLWPITRLGQTLDLYERARASAQRIFGLFNTEASIQSPVESKKLGRAKGEIAFKNVHFAYDSAMPVLKRLDFTIQPGEVIGFAGTTGAGKSTLIKLILRLYDPNQGAVCLDGHNLKDLHLQDLRRQMALVSQDVYLFHGSLRENIAYGLENATDTAIEAVARKAELHDFIVSLPQGYDTLVGERGIKLSGGQRQRLSIARAILKDAPILILDEATSSVDTETERAIQVHLNELVQGRTALIIAHRLSTLRQADRTLVLKAGQIAEMGHHEALLGQNGIYADLWRLQAGDLNPTST
ncbi:MAG: ABC transporter ATP-binding protein [Candidatus Sericytochromatia bacterium]|nr:ABC transporter ATP-binding protein [Candidatus Sericytochromatia bacterium]